MAKHFKPGKYQLVAVDFEDAIAYPDSKPSIEMFSDETDLRSKLNNDNLPVLIISPQELVDKGIEAIYVVSKSRYNPDGIKEETNG